MNTKTTIEVRPLVAADHAAWLPLAQDYKTFYKTSLPDEDYDIAWRRLLQGDDILALGAFMDQTLVGIAHYLFHTSVWAPQVCYLQDLFVDPAARGQGAARALIEAVAKVSRDRGAARYYWTTQEHNTTGRALYDKVAKFNGFIRYDYPLMG